MKNRTLLKLTLLGSILFFSACAKKQESLSAYDSPSLSIYNTIDMDETTAMTYQSQIDSVKDTYVPENGDVQDIEYISYGHPSSPLTHTQTIDNLKFLAKSFLGTPYVWGATGPDKFDCSGFTQWVFRDVGINIPRVSKDQAQVGQLISFNNLQAGDMMFFDTHKKRTGKVTHVGIYLGNGNFIHASSAGKKVVIYNFNKKTYYKKRFLWGRRVTNHSLHYASN